MVLAPAVRRQKLQDLIDTKKSVGKQKLHYRGQTQSFDVYRIDLDWLIYNRHNGRLEAEMLTWQQEHSVPPDHYDDALHSLIDNFLWTSNIGRNKHTLADLEKKEQQRAGIVSLDGVIIDGNRRAMLLRRLEAKKGKQWFDAIILPDAYDENEKEIVRLETQYQLGEDSQVEYGPLQKYLHARRLRHELNIPEEDIDDLMGESKGYAKRLLEIMELMDDYLEHIGCSGLYTMLKDGDGSKEGMFVDLYSDLKSIQSGKRRIDWQYDQELEPILLRAIQFDYIRLGIHADEKKSYRDISHRSKNANFFSHKDIWEKFRDSHQQSVDPVTVQVGTLTEYHAAHPDHETKVEAARARDNEWSQHVKGSMVGNFRKSGNSLFYKMDQLKPKEYLERAKAALEEIDPESEALLADPDNEALVLEINRRSFEMKKKFDRAGRSGQAKS